MTTEASTPEAATPPEPQPDAASEIRRLNENLAATIRLHRHLPLEIVVGALTCMLIDVYGQTRAAERQRILMQRQAVANPQPATSGPPAEQVPGNEARTGPTGIVPRMGGKGRNGKKRR